MSKETRQVLQLIELAKEMFYDGNAMTLSQKKTAWRDERALNRKENRRIGEGENTC